MPQDHRFDKDVCARPCARRCICCASRTSLLHLRRSWNRDICRCRRAADRLRRGRKAFDERRGPGNRRPRPAVTGHGASARGRRSPIGYPRRDGAAVGDRGGATYAALDLGTNNCRLLVARPTARRLSRRRRILPHHPARRGRLGLRPHQRRRDRRARSRRSRVCRDKMRNRGVDARAADRDRGLPRGRERRRIPAPASREEVGLELEIIDRETEARLAATGCTPLIDPDADGVILFDIGGGSSELVRLGPLAAGAARAAAAGDQGLGVAPGRRGDARRAPRRHAVTRETVRGHDRARSAALRRALRRRARRRRRAALHLLGTSGTVTTIAGRPSRTAALRSPPRRRLLDEPTRGDRAWSSGCSP